VQIERITWEAAPISQICLRRTTSVLSISTDYDYFVRQPSGVIERALGPFEPGGFRLDASEEIGDGESWQLPVFIAHALHKVGCLAGPDEFPDAVLWLTGTVDIDLRVGEVKFFADKLAASQGMLSAIVASGAPITLVVPDSNLTSVAERDIPAGGQVLGVRTANEVLRHGGLDAVTFPIDGSQTRAGELVPLSTGPIHLPRWRLIATGISLLVFAALGTSLVLFLPELEPGSTFWDCDQCPEMVVVPGGMFLMGSPPEEMERDEGEGPIRKVVVTPFAIGKYEVTRREFTSFVEDTGSTAGDSCFVRTSSGGRVDPLKSWRDPGYPQGIHDPVVCISWNSAKAYAAWLAARTGHEYRLPSEAEWEYVARVGTLSPFHYGPTITSDHANYNGTTRYANGEKGVYRKKTLPVGSFPANAFGVHDVHGNVWEWVGDCWNDSYRGAPQDGSPWLSGNCGRRGMRGGAWNSRPGNLHSANRTRYVLDYRNYNFGFRIARSLGR
jgi:formylglycine-generating enzyme required for sulfatase activity